MASSAKFGLFSQERVPVELEVVGDAEIGQQLVVRFRKVDRRPTKSASTPPTTPKSSVRTRPKRIPNRFSSCTNNVMMAFRISNTVVSWVFMWVPRQKMLDFLHALQALELPTGKAPIEEATQLLPGQKCEEARSRSTPEVTRPDLTKRWYGRHARISNSKFTRPRRR